MAKSDHQHPGQDEPGSYGQTHHERFEIDLNTASKEELEQLTMVGEERAQRLVQNRPFESWEDVERVPGFDKGMVDDPALRRCADRGQAALVLHSFCNSASLALARTFKIIDPDLKNPQSEHWERSFRIFDLLL